MPAARRAVERLRRLPSMRDHLAARRLGRAPGRGRRLAQHLAVRQAAQVEPLVAVTAAVHDAKGARHDRQRLQRLGRRARRGLGRDDAGHVVLQRDGLHAARPAAHATDSQVFLVRPLAGGPLAATGAEALAQPIGGDRRRVEPRRAWRDDDDRVGRTFGWENGDHEADAQTRVGGGAGLGQRGDPRVAERPCGAVLRGAAQPVEEHTPVPGIEPVRAARGHLRER